MKRCSNAGCRTDFLFGNDRTACPFCHSPLVDAAAAPRPGGILTPDQLTPPLERARPQTPFLTQRLGTVTCRGRVVEIDRQELFLSKFHKLVNSLFRGEPYQLAHQSIEYTIRVESLNPGVADRVTDFCLYGNYLGRLQVGDEVDIRARNKGNRRIVKALYNRTTESQVRPGFQLSAGAVRCIAFALMALVASLIIGLVNSVQSGALAAGFGALLGALMPIAIMLVGLWILIRSVFPGRRRRR